jgi:prepilin-type N-terminal cleavage/methylation domain-containing protein
MLNRKGFTLIELLIVVVIIGILAAIAIPKFSQTKEKAYVASMKSDLRNLGTAEEAYFADNLAYFGGTASNVGGAPVEVESYVPSAGVTVVITPTAGGGGVPASFNATATHVATAVSCAVYYGEPPAAPATAEGEPACTQP